MRLFLSFIHHTKKSRSCQTGKREKNNISMCFAVSFIRGSNTGKKEGNQLILFICTGNTCRSPLAAALARSRGIDAESAGLTVWPGSPATPEAVRAAARHGADLTRHQARAVTEELLIKADRVWVMTSGHWDALNARFPELAAKADVLYPEIPDPFGGDDRIYEACAVRLLDAMKRAGII